MNELHACLEALRTVHHRLRARLLDATERQTPDVLAAVAYQSQADTQYEIDRAGEETLLDALEACWAGLPPVLFIAEGVSEDGRVVPEGAPRDAVQYRLLMDPLDGTRGLMMQKRSAWILSGLAPERGPETSLQDLVVAVQTEVPLVKQHLMDEVWAVHGQQPTAVRTNRFTNARQTLTLRPSQSQTLAHGFGTVCRFFPGGREILARIDDAVVEAVEGPPHDRQSVVYEDQYISSGGQLFELMAGRDRYVADLRPALAPRLAREGQAAPTCAHPYDVTPVLIAQQAGVIVTDLQGQPLDSPLDTVTPVGWIGYANEALRQRIEPALQSAMRAEGLL